ncbi:hypothetical protein OKA05_03885 [Luteolibacter arcticus]|uniref:Uncharacterized protein n=1 Tax=Luteolibacter arcticus TaxID=1581411 RepID=A0ABT3GDP8_9BACT|nr:hypothetical protein [Luteolibacter arcticus]MCW1921679.1 hypothetical protein [Luteolibacter arcticus]
MTDPEKISRLASAAMDIPSFSPASPNSGPAIARPPFAIRKTLLCSECHASSTPMPFFPTRVAFYQEARVLFSERMAGANHRRSRPSRPSLASAACCLLTSLSALYVTSPRGEESLAGVARTVIQASNEAGAMVSNGTPDSKLEP